MEPTSSPDNARPQRGLARFWPVHRDADDPASEAAETRSDSLPEALSAASAMPLSGETEMVALGSRRGVDEGSGAFGGTPGGLAQSPVASAGRGPGDNGTPPPPGGPFGPGGGDGSAKPTGPSDRGPAGLPGPASGAFGSTAPGSPAAPVGGRPADDPEAKRSPWDRDTGSIGGFGLGGRNGKFLFGGRDTTEPAAPATNGHATPDLNGHRAEPADETSTVDGPAAPAADGDKNGRDEMNGRATTPGFPTGDKAPETSTPSAPVSGATAATSEATTRRRDLGDALESGKAATDARRQAAGWASVPTSKHPVVAPTSPAPTSSAPTSPAPTAPAPTAPTSGAPVPPPAFGQPPAYVPGLPDPASGPVSGVPAPRGAAAAIPVPAPPRAEPTTPEPADSTPSISRRARDEEPVGRRARDEATTAEPTGRRAAKEEPADTVVEDEPAADSLGARLREEITPAPRRSASLEDAEPARRGRRAAPDDEHREEMRPGDVAAGNIAFWDDDAIRHFRAAWHEVKAEFVDDPVTALTRAHDLLTEAVNELSESLLAERDELDPLRAGSTPDTESMRMAMRNYREFLERILAL